MQLRILFVLIETSSLRAEIVNNNRCISVRLVSDRLKALNWYDFDNSHNSFHDKNMSLIFYVKDGTHVRLRLRLHYRPETVHFSTKDA